MLDIEQQYDNIYRYCYFKLRDAQTAEDITQETFLRYWDRYHPMPSVLAIRYLYIIARNLCVDEYRKTALLPLEETITQPSEEEHILTQLTVQTALTKLSVQEQELLLLRYVNEVPVGTIAALWGISRFAVYRKLKTASDHFRSALSQEGFHENS